MDLAAHPSHVRFGRLLKFWRSAFGLSQEDFADTIGVSVRHLSFLETGKAGPSRMLVEHVAAALRLGSRDTGNLIQMAGFLPFARAGDLDSAGNEELRRGLVATLRCLDPHPAAVIDPCANVKMVNRAWVHMHVRLLGEAVIKPQVNTIRLLVAEDGWRRYMPNWAEFACLYLVILKQEAIMRESEEAERLLQDILATPGIPEDWAQRGARHSSEGHNHSQTMRTGDGALRTLINVHHTVGSTTFVSEPRLIIHAVLPEDGVPDVSLQELQARRDIAHPLLPY